MLSTHERLTEGKKQIRSEPGAPDAVLIVIPCRVPRLDRFFDGSGLLAYALGSELPLAKKKRKYLTWRRKGEILSVLEVSYVPSSPPFVAAPAKTPRW